jgi:hypothetical protein
MQGADNYVTENFAGIQIVRERTISKLFVCLNKGAELDEFTSVNSIKTLYKGFIHKNRGSLSGASFMGEEKPDEELMGKRKPAPRLSTTFCDVDSYRMARLADFYTSVLRNF